MTYFQKYYSEIKLPIITKSQSGLRRAQLGAIHSIAAYYTRKNDRSLLDPAIIVLPTGSGKTAVLILSPFLLRVKKCLIIVPSKLIRSQIVEELNSLNLLKKVGVVPKNLKSPKVYELKKRLSSLNQWNKIKKNDIIVSTPHCISPSYKEIYQIPKNSFELILFDEGHHLPATTWAKISNYFDGSMKILFTATPFRNDFKGIIGKIIYEFSIREAYEDKIFGEIKFIPVTIKGDDIKDSNSDILIAKKTEEIYIKDQEMNLTHLIMVKSSSIKNSKELKNIYDKHTKLNLKLLNSSHSDKYVKKIISELKSNMIDGVIAINILNEGIDIPNLKIAALHSTYKSLGILLQFIGRFARTGDQQIGIAKFIAIPQQIKSDAMGLYGQDRKWQDIIPDLYQSKIEKEMKLRDAIYSFIEIPQNNQNIYEGIENLSLSNFRPRLHVKVFRVTGTVNLENNIKLPKSTIVKQEYSSELSCLVLLTKFVEQPKWTSSNILDTVRFDLIIVYYIESSKLVFINSSQKSNILYDLIINQITAGPYSPLLSSEINKVLKYLNNPEFYNIGMRRRTIGGNKESYRIIAGTNVDKSISKNDGFGFVRGHVVGNSKVGETQKTIGVSSGSKIWSSNSALIPDFIEWCNELNLLVNNDETHFTGTQLDNLKTGSKINQFPSNIIFAQWHESVYQDSYRVNYLTPSNELQENILIDFSIKINASSSDLITFKVFNDDITWIGKYRVSYPFFKEGSELNPVLKVLNGDEEIDFLSFINNNPIIFYTNKLSLIQGMEQWDLPILSESFDMENIISLDWNQNNVDITNEANLLTDKGISIQSFLLDYYSDKRDIVFFDHGSGEICDLIVFQSVNNTLVVEFVHVKSSSEPNPGRRVKDIDELFGQLLRSIKWGDINILIEQIKYRLTKSSIFHKGSIIQLIELIENNQGTIFRLIGVQPGLLKERLNDRILLQLQSVKEFINIFNFDSLQLIISSNSN